ncbi:MAG: DUF1697 domain-containing protein [Thermoleophilia bacterium]|nr:DUF1697 domain-containing protein [Thermoleophilia bacterium]
MASYVALLRAVNVGGTGKLPMAELRAMCEEAGFESVETYIASGNVVFKSGDSEDKVKSIIEKRLEAYAGKKVDVYVRTVREMKDLVEVNPYPKEPGNKTAVLFLDQKPPADLDAIASGIKDEKFEGAAREIFISYPDGLGTTKLAFDKKVIHGTTRNMNTVAKLAEMAADL